MRSWILAVMEQWGYLGMGLLIAVENLFPPIPSELILTFGGFLTTQTALRLSGMILYATLGSLTGAAVLYGVGRLLTPQRLAALLDRPLCRRLGFEKAEILSAVERFGRQGKKAVLLGRFVPILRSLVSIPAGMARMEFCPFLWLTALGSALWNTALLALGAAAGASWQLLAARCGEWIELIKWLLLAAALVWLLLRAAKKRRRQNR